MSATPAPMSAPTLSDEEIADCLPDSGPFSTLKFARAVIDADRTLRAGQSEPVAALRELVALKTQLDVLIVGALNDESSRAFQNVCHKLIPAWSNARAALASIPTDGTKDIDDEY